MKWRMGIIFRLGSFWMGVHYSKATKRYCINLVPCVTIWVAEPGGQAPKGPDFGQNWELTRLPS